MLFIKPLGTFAIKALPSLVILCGCLLWVSRKPSWQSTTCLVGTSLSFISIIANFILLRMLTPAISIIIITINLLGAAGFGIGFIGLTLTKARSED